MKYFTRILAVVVLLCLMKTNARHVENNDEELSEVDGQELTNQMANHATQTRHRRRSRQMFGYDYPPPYFYGDHRRDYNIQQHDEQLSQIVKSLDDILRYIKTPQVSPQPVYIPYPVVQYRPCICRTTTCRPSTPKNNDTDIPSFPDRASINVNDNRNWGLLDEEPVELTDDESYGSRPINLTPVEPKKPMSRPPPPVDHGSSQAGVELTTRGPAVSQPGTCEGAILTCCSMSDKTTRANCFARYNCSKTYETNRACSPDVVRRVLEHFRKAYAPNNTID